MCTNKLWNSLFISVTLKDDNFKFDTQPLNLKLIGA